MAKGKANGDLDSDSGIVTIYPRGDVYLSAQTEDGTTRRFLASSTVLGLGSTYWKAMFDSKYVEGQILKASDRPTFATDAEPRILELLLWAMHVNFDRLPKYVTVETLYEVAILADLYCCQCHVAFMLRPQLQLAEARFRTYEETVYLAGARAALNDAIGYRRLTRELVWLRREPETIPLKLECLGESEHRMIEKHRDAIQTRLDTALTRFLKIKSRLSYDVKFSEREMRRFHRVFTRGALVDHHKALLHTLCLFRKKVTEVEISERDGPQYSLGALPLLKWLRTYDAINVVWAAVEAVEEDCRGLCLVCVRMGRAGAADCGDEHGRGEKDRNDGMRVQKDVKIPRWRALPEGEMWNVKSEGKCGGM